MEDVEDFETENDIANVSEARLKLDDLLNEIIDKNEDSLSDDESRRSRTGSASTTPSKRHYSARVPRKKKKKEVVYEGISDLNKPSYVIKLFDRRVDLAQFGADTPLYVMVREWMKNKPFTTQSQVISTEVIPPVETRVVTFDDQDSQGETEDVVDNFLFELPAPVKADDNFAPRPLPPALKTALIENIINTENDIEELRKDNMIRWRKVRNRWKEHSFRQQQRYVESLKILKKAFNVQNLTTT